MPPSPREISGENPTPFSMPQMCRCVRTPAALDRQAPHDTAAEACQLMGRSETPLRAPDSSLFRLRCQITLGHLTPPYA